MSLMAVFNCSFFIMLILFLLIVGLIWIHFNKKIDNQNINMNQMVRLLTTMTQEVSLLRKKVGLSDEIIDISEDEVLNKIKQEKIDVSDDEEDSDDDSDSNSDDSDDDSDDSDSESEDEKENIQLIEVEELKMEELNKLDEQLEILEEQLNKLESPAKEVEEEQLEEVEDVEEKMEEHQDKEEYKKMSLNKLKSLVLEKKLTTDVSKLKKSDLLTILGVEV
jgi:hypothetical protein